MDQHKKKILVVEDEIPLLKIISERLIAEGFDVYGAQDGKEALEQVEAKQPNLILLDILIPKIDGIEVLKQLHSHRTKRQIPVIILTNLDDSTAIINALNHGGRIRSTRRVYNDSDEGFDTEENLNAYMNARLREGKYEVMVKKNSRLAEIVEKVKIMI